MTAHIYQEDLDFLEEAKQVFENDIRRETHTNDDEDLIALRRGEDRDCVHIIRLGEEVMFVHDVVAVTSAIPVAATSIEIIVKEYKKSMDLPRLSGDAYRNGIKMTLIQLGIEIEGVSAK